MAMQPPIKPLLGEFEKKYAHDILVPFLDDLQRLLVGKEITNRIPTEVADGLAKLFEEHTKEFEAMLLAYGEKTEEQAIIQLMLDLEKSLGTGKIKVGNKTFMINTATGRILRQVKNEVKTLVNVRRPVAYNTWMNYRINGLTLSQRVWKNAEQMQELVKNKILETVFSGRSAKELAEELAKNEQVIEIPKYVQKMIKNADPDKVAEIIANYTKEKMEYNAMRVARTEIQRAWRAEYTENAKRLDFVKGIKWNLSHQHPKYDICDQIAATDVGLGPGVYPPEAVPFNGAPAHPNCMCYLTSVIDEEKIKEV